MKIKADYVNAPQWRELTVKSRLPEQLKCLDELAHNMWWAWNYEARDLWRSLDEKLYEEVGHNPVLLLERLSYDRKEEIVKDKTIMKKVKDVYSLFRKYMDVKPNTKRPLCPITVDTGNPSISVYLMICSIWIRSAKSPSPDPRTSAISGLKSVFFLTLSRHVINF